MKNASLIYLVFIAFLLINIRCGNDEKKPAANEIIPSSFEPGTRLDTSVTKSSSVLKSFYLVEKSMLKSGKNIDDRNMQILSALEKAVDREPSQAKPYLDAAKEINGKVKDFVKYIDEIKLFLEAETGGRYKKGTQSEGQLEGRNNMEKHAIYMIDERHGEDIKKHINDLNTALTTIIKNVPNPIDAKKLLSLNELVAKDDPENSPQTWQSELFEHSPLAAVITLLTKFQNDAKNAGSECMAELALRINDH